MFLGVGQVTFMSPSLKDCFGKAVGKGAAAASKVREPTAVGDPNKVFG